MIWYESNNESCESSDTEDPNVDFKQLINQAKDWEFPPELKRMVEQDDRDVKPH